LKPFFLSSLGLPLTAEQAAYIGQFPLAIINHKMAASARPRNGAAEAKQLAALAAIKAANSSCQTHFYLNSLIDFPALAMHRKFEEAPNGSWWMKESNGDYVMHKSDHIIDFSVAAAKDTWLSTAAAALSQPYVDGIFVDKADGEGFKGVSKEHMTAWNTAHSMMLSQLRNSSSKNVILNNVHVFHSGQLFERWGNPIDHNRLDVKQDIELLRSLSSQGVTALARAGGTTPGSAIVPDPVACGAGLAAFLVGTQDSATDQVIMSS
jgi:hypothetical protein